MTDTNKWVDVVAKLTRLTQERKLKWEARSDPVSGYASGHSDYVSAPFYTTYKDRHLRVVKRKPNPFLLVSTAAIFGPKEWVSLDLVDPHGGVIFSFPHVAGVSDLFQAVQFQVAGAESMLDDFLKDSD